MKQTQLAFLHEDNQYHSPYILGYWSGIRVRDFVGKLWPGAVKGEYLEMAYKRNYNLISLDIPSTVILR